MSYAAKLSSFVWFAIFVVFFLVCNIPGMLCVSGIVSFRCFAVTMDSFFALMRCPVARAYVITMKHLLPLLPNQSHSPSSLSYSSLRISYTPPHPSYYYCATFLEWLSFLSLLTPNRSPTLIVHLLHYYPPSPQ